jgi:hypothetical protein
LRACAVESSTKSENVFAPINSLAKSKAVTETALSRAIAAAGGGLPKTDQS